MLRTLNIITPAAKPPRRGRWIKRLGFAVALYTVFGFLLLPAIIKWQMVKQLPVLTHRTARVEAVRLNPYALSLTIRGFALTEQDGSTFMSFSNFHANFEAWSSLWNRTWTLGEVQLGSPYGYAAILTNGQFNFANLLTNVPATNGPVAASKPPPPLLVESLVITNGTFAVADFYRAAHFKTQFTPIDVRLTNFTTRPRTGSPYAFTASTGEGEYFKWAGRVGVFPPSSSGQFELGGIDLKKYGTYVGEFTQLELRDGKVTVGATYAFAVETNGVELTVTNASVLLTNLAVFAPGATNMLATIPSVAVRGAQANLQERTARVRSIETFGGSILARRFGDGLLQLLQLAAPPAHRPPSILNPPLKTNSGPVVAAAPAAPWSVLIENIVVQDYTARVEDEHTPRPATLVTDQIALTVQGLSLASNAPVTIQVSARVNRTGTVKLAAQGTVLPVALDADLDVSTIDLRPFQPYVEQQRVKLEFKSGNVSTKGRASVALAGTNPPALKFTGDVVLDDVAVVDQIVFQDFVKWKQVAVRGIDFVLAPMSVKIHELACTDVAASVVMGTNGQLTVLAALPANTNAAPAVAAPKPVATAGGGLPFPLQLDLLALTNTSIHLADFSIQPNCRFAVQQFSGTVRGLSSAPGAVADVDIHGRMNESAPFSVTGKIKPLFADLSDLLVDLVITNKNTDLTAFTPYMEKFGGYPLAKGKVTVGLRYDVKQGALKAENIIFIDQLTLGQKNNSPAATSLPVKLGVALLKDRNGRIELDVPLSGRLDDPKFRLGPIVLQVLGNMLTKVATSPFSLLGALVGGGEELSFVEFTPGQSVIGETELAKIDKLGKALYERPALNLEITGAADEALDRAALAWLRLERDLKTLRLAELAGKPDAAASVEDLKLESRDYTRLLKAQHQRLLEGNSSAPSNPAQPGETNAFGVAKTNALAAPRAVARKGAEMLSTRPAPKTEGKATNAVASAQIDAAAVTRPKTFPAVATDETLGQMESELFQRIKISDSEVQELMKARALVVQRQLLKTEKVTDDRLFILAPKPTDAASKGQSRVNLSLN